MKKFFKAFRFLFKAFSRGKDVQKLMGGGKKGKE